MHIGIDIIKNSRVKLDPPFIKRILSEAELKTFNSFDNKVRKREFLAGRGAAKEAIFKCKHENLAMSQIEILNDEKGSPYVANEELKGVVVSLSHEKKYTVAVAVSEK